jgi:hypothetical protein
LALATLWRPALSSALLSVRESTPSSELPSALSSAQQLEPLLRLVLQAALP